MYYRGCLLLWQFIVLDLCASLLPRFFEKQPSYIFVFKKPPPPLILSPLLPSLSHISLPHWIPPLLPIGSHCSPPPPHRIPPSHLQPQPHRCCWTSLFLPPPPPVVPRTDILLCRRNASSPLSETMTTPRSSIPASTVTDLTLLVDDGD